MQGKFNIALNTNWAELSEGITYNFELFEPFVQYHIANKMQQTPTSSNPGSNRPQWGFRSKFTEILPQRGLNLVYRVMNKTEISGDIEVGRGAIPLAQLLSQRAGNGSFPVYNQFGEQIGVLGMSFQNEQSFNQPEVGEFIPRASIVVDTSKKARKGASVRSKRNRIRRRNGRSGASTARAGFFRPRREFENMRQSHYVGRSEMLPRGGRSLADSAGCFC